MPGLLTFWSKARRIFSFSNKDDSSTGKEVKSLDKSVQQDKPTNSTFNAYELDFTCRSVETKPNDSRQDARKLMRAALNQYKYPWTKSVTGDSSDSDTTSPDLEGRFTCVLIKAQDGYLGLTVVGGVDTALRHLFVKDILPNSPASNSCSLKTGDQLVEVNGEVLEGLSHAGALSMLRNLPSVVRLVVLRKRNGDKVLLDPSRSFAEAPSKNPDTFSLDETPNNVPLRATESDVVVKVVSPVADVTRRSLPARRPQSRCTSFLVKSDEKVEDNKMFSDGDRKSISRKQEEKEDKGVSSSLHDEDANHSGRQRKHVSCTQKNSGERTFQPTKEDWVRVQQQLCHCGASPRRLGRNVAAGEREISSTWPTMARKNRSSLHWDTFLPPSSHALVQPSTTSTLQYRRSQVVSAVFPSNQHITRTISRAKGKLYIEKTTFAVKIRRKSTADSWGFILGGGTHSAYGDLPIHVVEVSEQGGAHGVIKSGDEIIQFIGHSMEDKTCLEAEQIVRNSLGTCATVLIKRNRVEKNSRLQCNTYSEIWHRKIDQQGKMRRSLSVYY